MSELISHDQVLINAAAARNETSIAEGSMSVTAAGPNTNSDKPGEYSATLTGNGTDVKGSVTIQYDRLLVDEVIAAVDIDRLAIRANTVTGEQIAQLIRDHLGINILASDLTAQSFGPFEERTQITVDVKSDSLLFRGNLTVIAEPLRDIDTGELVLVNTGREPLAPEEGLTPEPIAFDYALSIPGEAKGNGSMAHGSGVRGTDFARVTNGELSLALATRIWKSNAAIPRDEDNKMLVELNQTQDWNVPFSFALTEAAPAGKITDLYDIVFVWDYLDTNESMRWVLKEIDGNIVLEHTDGIQITDNTVVSEGRVVQNIQRMFHYIHNEPSGNDYFHPIETNEAGSPLGDFTFTVTAYRRNSLAEPLQLVVRHQAYVPAPQ